MKFILFLMFLVTPPSAIKNTDKGGPNDKRVWALQSTAAMEFSSIKLCQEIGESIARSTKVTATIITRFYCFPKNDADLNSLLADKKIETMRTPGQKPLTEEERREKAIDDVTTFKPQ